ncbi:tail protein X [Carnimonas bestiolae]|uniref:tail protein X n=1 Tax=Carnimonas bestiolae TaxID=3402172 RepID=UPI003EDC4B01
MSNQAISQQGETLDALCYRLGIDSSLVVTVYELNRGLADLGPVLPQGMLVNMPDTIAPKRSAKTVINLWD